MIGKKMAEALNNQVNREFYSAYFYLSMSAYGDFLGLKGFAGWFMTKNLEETQHALKIYKYLLDQGVQINLLPVAQPPATFESPLAMFEITLAHEQGVTQNFNELIELAMTEKDYATQIFLQWFITEQIEEEATVAEIIHKIKLIGGKGDGLFMIDNQLKQMAAQINLASVTVTT
jgi:ferritin